MNLYLMILLSIVALQSQVQATEDRMHLPVIGMIIPKKDVALAHCEMHYHVGQIFEISFNTLPGCGIYWGLKPIENDIVALESIESIVEDTYRDLKPLGGRVLEIQIFKFRALRPGKTTLCFTNAQRTQTKYYHIEIE